jgi:N-methylhydantoinase A/oxoprolinase/acetone carboxylase beta subunit
VLGIDIGGTFTDFVLCHVPTGNVWLAKHLTTPDDHARAVRDGLAELTRRAGVTGADLEVVIHGTTLITNALLERKGVATALVATDGHRDVLEIGSEIRYDTYDLHLERPEPLVARPLRHQVPERCFPSGEVLTPLDETAMRDIARELAKANVEAVAVCFLHSFVNPHHEQRARAILNEAMPGVAVSLSSEVAPEIREYPRMSTTVANAYVQPIAERYLLRLHADLATSGYTRPLYMMLSSGGIATHDTAARFPIRLIESGPVAGALATVTLGQRMGRGNLIAFDMGGTTAKASLIDGGTLTAGKEFEVARVKRFKKGSGLPLQVPVIEMIEIGAGGGSVARRGDMGLLKVGPESAGADPGPACYGLGGTEPTVTDADLLLGYLDPDNFLGGTMKLDVAAARSAVEGLAAKLDVAPDRLVRGIFEVVNANMIAAAKVHISERGRDARRYALVAFGGMGPMHAHAVATGLKLREVICPASAGVLSAWGMLVAPISFEYGRSFVGALSGGFLERAEAVFAEMQADGARMLTEAGVPENEIRYQRSADMRYVGQYRELTVPLPDKLEGDPVTAIRKVFFEHYRRAYGHAHTDVEVQVVTCRLVASSPQRSLSNRAVAAPGGQPTKKRQRQIYFDAVGGYVPADVYDRYELRPGATLDGPAVLEERESTAVVPPGARARIDDELNLIIDLGLEA